MRRRQDRSYGERPTAVMPSLRDADITPTSIRPVPALRDVRTPGTCLPASAHDLPLWRPQLSPTARRAPTDTQAAPHTMDDPRQRRIHALRRELATTCAQWPDDDKAFWDTLAVVGMLVAELQALHWFASPVSFPSG